MTTVLLILHLFVTLALIGIVLIQRSEGGGLGIGTSQGMGGFMSGRGTANLLTRTTAVLATLFMALALALALLNRGGGRGGHSLLDVPPPPASLTLAPTPKAAPTPKTAPAEGSAAPQPANPAAPGAPASGAAPAEGAVSPPPGKPTPPPVPTN